MNGYPETSPVPPLDIFQPVYGNFNVSVSELPNHYFEVHSSDWYGVYFQDQITLLDKVHILGGGRYDWASSSTGATETSLADARITRNEDGLEGRRLPNVAEHGGSLWLKYEFLEGFLKGLSLGGGVYAFSDRQGDKENTFILPAHVRADAFAAYAWQIGPSRLTAQINITNFTDEEYYAVAAADHGAPRLQIYPGEPLTVLGSIRVEF